MCHKLDMGQHQAMKGKDNLDVRIGDKAKLRKRHFLGNTKRILREQERKSSETSLKEMSNWGENSIIGR